MKNVMVVLCFKKNGHWLHYAKLVCDAYKRRQTVVLCCPESVLNSDEFQTYFAKNQVETLLATYETEAAEYLYLLRSKKYSHVFGIDLQTYWWKILPKMFFYKMMSPISCSGIICQTSFAYSDNKLSKLKKIRCFILRQIACRIFDRLFFIDQEAFFLLFPKGAKKNCYCLEDPLEPPVEECQSVLKQRYGWKETDQILSSIGLMYDTKRLDLLVAAFLDMKPTEHQFLYLCGRFYTDMKSVIEEMVTTSSYGKQVIIDDRWLGVEEFGELIMASDYIAATYENHFGNSSLILRASQAEKPVIGSDSGWIGRYVHSHECGEVVNIYNKKEYTDGLKRIFSGEVSNKNSLLGCHSEEKFKDDLLK